MEQISSSTATAGGDRSTPTAWRFSPLTLAIGLACFDHYERTLLYDARMQCAFLWDYESGEDGPSQLKRFPIRFKLSLLSNGSERRARCLRRAIRSLLAAQTLYRHPDGAFRLNGYFAAWLDPATGRPRLDGEDLAHCLEDRS